MSLDPITAGMDLIGKAIDRFVPDPAQRDAAKLAMYEAQRAGDMDTVKVAMSAILAEANSADPWTSRARPSFLYVVYVLLLFGLPMGFLAAYSPATAGNVAREMRTYTNSVDHFVPFSLRPHVDHDRCTRRSSSRWASCKTIARAAASRPRP